MSALLGIAGSFAPVRPQFAGVTEQPMRVGLRIVRSLEVDLRVLVQESKLAAVPEPDEDADPVAWIK